MGKPGEWFKAADSDLLSYQAADGEDPNTRRFEFKRRPYAFDLSDRSYITLTGFSFRGASVDKLPQRSQHL